MKTARRFRAALCCALAVSLCAGSALADLPEGYTQLPFVKASGQCRVRTGLTPSCTDKAELTFELSTVSGNQNLWCSRADGTGQFTTFMIADKVRFDRNATQTSTSGALVAAKKYTVTADYATGAGTVTDADTGAAVTSVEMGTGEYTPASELCLFASHSSNVETGLDNFGSWTFYSFKLRDADGNLRCDLVPAWRAADGAFGLYDIVRSTFLANELDGEFTLGTGYSVDENGDVLVAVTAEAQGGGTIRVGEGEAAATVSAQIKLDGTGSVTLTAIPGEGCRLYRWELPDGVEPTQGTVFDNAIGIPAAQPISVKAVFYALSDVCAKLVEGSFRFYKDDTCLPASELRPQDAPASIAGIKVLFANDAEYQALVPFTNELATALGGVAQLQADVTLTGDADWSAMDFNMNGKAVTLRGYDLKVSRPQGTGRFSAGNLINPLSASGNGTSTWSGGNGWWNVGTSSKKDALWWNFTPPKSRNIYINCKTKKYASTYLQYVFFSVGGTTYMNYPRTDNAGEKWWGPWAKAVTGGTQIQAMVRRNNGYSVIGFVTISPESHLTFDIPEGEEYSTANLSFGGASASTYEGDYGMGLEIHKTGKGTLLMDKEWTMATAVVNGTTRSMVVEEGLVKKASGKTAGGQYSQIVVEDGAQFDLNGRTYHDYNYTLSGSGIGGTGALTSTAQIDAATAYAQNTGMSFLRDVTLGGDATIYAAGNMGMIFYNYSANTMTMGGHTVTYDGVEDVDGEGNGTGVGAYRTFLGNMSYSGEGKIVVAKNGWVQGHISTVAAGGCDVEVYGRYWQNTGRISPVKSLLFKKGSAFRELNASPAGIMVYSAYAPNEISESADGYRKHPTVQLGDASHLATTLDFSCLTEPFDDSEDGTLTIYSSAADRHVVTVEIGDRTEGLAYRYLYKWKTPPENVEFVRSERMEQRKIVLEVRADGLAVAKGAILIIR